MTTENDLIFKAGEVIFDTEEPLDLAYFILEGEVALSLRLKGREVSIPVSENQFIGDASVAFEQKQTSKAFGYSAKAVATTDVRAVPMPVQHIKSELAKCPAMIRAWFASFLKRMLILVDQLTDTKG